MNKYIALSLLACTLPVNLAAQDSGFLSDYSKLTEGGASGFTRVYIAPNAPDAMGRFSKVMIDQPEFFISPDSKYKGFKPSDSVMVGEELRAAMIEGVGTNLAIVEEPGKDTGLIQWAVTNIRVNKAKRGVLSFTPVGAVAYGAKKAMSDIVEKTRAFDVVFEVEGLDSVTGEVLFAMVFDMTAAGEEAEWGQALMLTRGLGKRISCRINNSRLAADERQDCLAIPISGD